MSATIRRLRKERVDADVAALELTEANLSTALARRAEAKRALDEITLEVAVLEDIRNTMAGRLEASRPDLLRLCVAAIPDDILRCIFEVVCESDDYTDPFYLAAVCARWRRVALAFPSLWTAVYSMPSSESRVIADYNRVVTMLSRSGTSPVNVCISWRIILRASQPESAEVLNKTLRALASHVSRWRIALFALPESADIAALDCLKGPTPLLTDLTFDLLSQEPDAVLWSESGYLPFAPLLRNLTIGRTVMDCSSRSSFPALKKLSVGDGASSDDVVYDYLTRSPSLVHLNLSHTITQAPRARITLSELQSLVLDSNSQRLLWEPASSFLVMPRLKRLTLDCAAEDAVIPLLDAVSASVRTLNLGAALTLHQLSVLSHLSNIETLKFIPLPLHYVDGSAFERLASSDPPIWPRLSSLVYVEYEDGMAAHILRLIAARNAPPNADDDGAASNTPRPCKLREVKFRSAAPSWLVQEVQRLLRLST